MNATLEKELAGLTLQEKAEVIDYLLPEVIGTDTEIPADLLAELERRDIAFEANPASGITLEEFEGLLLKRK
jgi:hypothetical protein